jgi:hypothetical protein
MVVSNQFGIILEKSKNILIWLLLSLYFIINYRFWLHLYEIGIKPSHTSEKSHTLDGIDLSTSHTLTKSGNSAITRKIRQMYELAIISRPQTINK